MVEALPLPRHQKSKQHIGTKLQILNLSLQIGLKTFNLAMVQARAKNVPLVINMAVPATAVQAFFKLQNLAILFLAKWLDCFRRLLLL